MRSGNLCFKGGLALSCAAFALGAGLAFGVAAPAVAAPASDGWNASHTKYYSKGAAVTGAAKIDGKWRAFNKNGKLMTKTFTLKGVTYYPGTNGVLRARKVNGSLRYANNRVMVKGDRLDFNCLLYAEKIVKKVTKVSDSKATKRYKCFKHISNKAYVDHRKWSYDRIGWPAIYAMDQLSGRGGDCVADACSFAYLAAAIGYKNVYVCTDTKETYRDPHSWCMIGNRIFDTMFARVKSWSTYYNSLGGSYEKYPTQRFAIPQYSPSHAGKKSVAVKSYVKKKGFKKEGSSYYYYVDGKKLRNSWKTIGGKCYWFRSSGKAVVKPCKVGKSYYVFNSRGVLQRGSKTRVVSVGGVKYQVTKAGKAKQGWDVSHKRLFKKNGAQYKGSCRYKGKLYYLSAKGTYNKEKTAKLRALAVRGASALELLALMGKSQGKHRVESCVLFNGESGDDVVYRYQNLSVQTFVVTQKGAADAGTEYVYGVNSR